MARERHKLADRPVATQPAEAGAAEGTLLGFAEEFRHLASQRRFERSGSKPAADARKDAIRSAIVGTDRLSHDAGAALQELARMAERVIEAREALGAERARADRAERELASADQRMLAARGLVQEAQRTARVAAERCSYLEGRCEALDQALDMALNASVIQRWKWRRQLRAQGREQS